MTGTTEQVTDEDVALEWRRRAERPGLARVMRASQPDTLNTGVTEQTRQVVGDQLALVAEHLGHRPRSALEIGCGIGRLTPTIAAHADRVHAVDMTPAMLDQARAACGGLATVDFSCERIDRMAVPRQRYDTAVCVWVLMHVLDEEQLTAACHTIAASTRYLTLIEYEGANVPVSRWSRLRTLDEYLALMPGGEVVDRRVVDYGGDTSFAALIGFGGEAGR
ncbi:class I SAM-dependent methyltransferase [Actinophytocola glycyrrhizae]|uniref:Class I SAM-dependent methyltransferase n=1 Tax=Actinophytocola glycyrrhizae TaxID=2044873 RepID=A0ABV9S8K4_9PSEU